MRENYFLPVSKSISIVLFVLLSTTLFAQQQNTAPNDFWKNVQFGGGIGLNFGSGYTDVSISPSAIYNVNQTLAFGTALQFGYISSKNYYESYS